MHGPQLRAGGLDTAEGECTACKLVCRLDFFTVELSVNGRHSNVHEQTKNERTKTGLHKSTEKETVIPSRATSYTFLHLFIPHFIVSRSADM